MEAFWKGASRVRKAVGASRGFMEPFCSPIPMPSYRSSPIDGRFSSLAYCSLVLSSQIVLRKALDDSDLKVKSQVSDLPCQNHISRVLEEESNTGLVEYHAAFPRSDGSWAQASTISKPGRSSSPTVMQHYFFSLLTISSSMTLPPSGNRSSASTVSNLGPCWTDTKSSQFMLEESKEMQISCHASIQQPRAAYQEQYQKQDSRC